MAKRRGRPAKFDRTMTSAERQRKKRDALFGLGGQLPKPPKKIVGLRVPPVDDSPAHAIPLTVAVENRKVQGELFGGHKAPARDSLRVQGDPAKRNMSENTKTERLELDRVGLDAAPQKIDASISNGTLITRGSPDLITDAETALMNLLAQWDDLMAPTADPRGKEFAITMLATLKRKVGKRRLAGGE